MEGLYSISVLWFKGTLAEAQPTLIDNPYCRYFWNKYWTSFITMQYAFVWVFMTSLLVEGNCWPLVYIYILLVDTTWRVIFLYSKFTLSERKCHKIYNISCDRSFLDANPSPPPESLKKLQWIANLLWKGSLYTIKQCTVNVEIVAGVIFAIFAISASSRKCYQRENKTFITLLRKYE